VADDLAVSESSCRSIGVDGHRSSDAQRSHALTSVDDPSPDQEICLAEE